MDFNEDYSVGFATGESIILPVYWLYKKLCNPIEPQIGKHRKIVKINKKKIKSKRRMIKQSRKCNRK